MGVYRYIAFDVAGKRRRGYVEADDPVQARARLKGRELFASRISEGGARSAEKYPKKTERVLGQLQGWRDKVRESVGRWAPNEAAALEQDN